MTNNTHPRPHLDISSQLRPPSYPSPTAWVPSISGYSDSPRIATPSRLSVHNSYHDSDPRTYRPASVNLTHSRRSDGPRPTSYMGSVHDPDASLWRFPEPQIQRSISQPKSLLRPNQSPTHRYAKSDIGPHLHVPRDQSSSPSPKTLPLTPEGSVNGLEEELSSMTLESEEGLNRFQAGELSPADEEWHRLVPEVAREAIGEREVQRQSVIFEVFKSEKDYVSDLVSVREVIIQPLRSASVIPEDDVFNFIKEVFWNLDEIIAIHEGMLASLFARQREQHPLIQSISDIILETALQFQPAYESYIKHYPLAEARHRRELKSNARYQRFTQECMHDPRTKKRDIVTFISRPVTRLPRLSLVLEHVLKLTAPEHPDLETMPLILSILSDFIKSTQPGIAAAESKVQFWSVNERLVFRGGEIIDMDMYDESRTLIHSGSLARHQKNEISLDWNSWSDLFVALLDNYFIMTRSETLSSGVEKYNITSRPIPLHFLRLGMFDQPPEHRKERADDGRMLESLRFRFRPIYPFTVYHAAAKSARRYTLFANSEAGRRKWHDALVDALGVHSVRQEANEWFASKTLSDDFFRSKTALAPGSSSDRFTGVVTAAASFISAGKKFLAVGCGTGIFIAMRGSTTFRKVLKLANPVAMVAIQDYNKFLVQYDGVLVAYSLELLARVSQGQSPPAALDASLDKLAGQDGTVTSFRAGPVANRMIVVYTSKTFRQTTIHALEVINPSQVPSTPRRHNGGSMSFRSFGDPFYVPRQAFDMTLLTRTIAIATEKGIINVDPTNLSSSSVLVVPDFTGAGSDEHMASLKSRCDAAKPLGLARSNRDEILIIYEEFGCYVTRHGKPCRGSGFIRWEVKATQYAHRGTHILLFSAEFIEVRNVQTGRLVQVLEGKDMRLLSSGPPPAGPVLAARRGKKEDGRGISDDIFELVETAEIATATPATTTTVDGLWDEWDM